MWCSSTMIRRNNSTSGECPVITLDYFQEVLQSNRKYWVHSGKRFRLWILSIGDTCPLLCTSKPKRQTENLKIARFGKVEAERQTQRKFKTNIKKSKARFSLTRFCILIFLSTNTNRCDLLNLSFLLLFRHQIQSVRSLISLYNPNFGFRSARAGKLKIRITNRTNVTVK